MYRWARLLGPVVALSLAMNLPARADFDPLDPLGEHKRLKLEIEVARGDWGRTDVSEVRRVLESVAKEFLAVVDPPRDELRVRVVPRGGAPRVLFQRGPDGRYVIQLTARDVRWFQYAYQFSHELCHVMSNFEVRQVAEDQFEVRNQWFEEALCETASLFTLKRVAGAWESHPPSRAWAGYADTFAAYAEHLMDEPHRHLLFNRSVGEWYAQNEAELSRNPYLRTRNEALASRLLPLFEERPQLWHSIIYLNPDHDSPGKEFRDYLGDWYAADPDKTLPGAVLALFGIAAPRPPSGALPVPSGEGLPGGSGATAAALAAPTGR